MLLVATAFPVFALGTACEPWYGEDFESLGNWRAFNLPGVDETTSFSTSEDVLRIQSRAAASGVLWNEVVDMSKVKSLRWRVRFLWMPTKADLTRRRQDDSPLRLMLLFSDDREELLKLEPDPDDNDLPIMSLIKGRAACDLLVYAAVPDGTDMEKRPYVSPVSGDIMLMPWQAKMLPNGKWQEMQVCPNADFEWAFGKPRPRWMRLAVVTDMDDMQGNAAVMLDKIELCGE